MVPLTRMSPGRDHTDLICRHPVGTSAPLTLQYAPRSALLVFLACRRGFLTVGPCSGCRRPIGATTGVPFVERDGLPWHLDCFRERFIPRCAVCHQFIPEQVG